MTSGGSFLLPVAAWAARGLQGAFHHPGSAVHRGQVCRPAPSPMGGRPRPAGRANAPASQFRREGRPRHDIVQILTCPHSLPIQAGARVLVTEPKEQGR